MAPGPGPLLQHCFSNDLETCLGPRARPLKDGRCVYGAFLDECGHVIDDAIVFQCGAEHYLVVINAGMGVVVSEHLNRFVRDLQTEILDWSDRVGKIDLQGPAAARILQPLLISADRVFADFPYFSFKGHFDANRLKASEVRMRDGTPLLLSRTGYTGEFGFEIFVAPEHTVALWDQLLAAGRDHDLIPCGLASRDSLRVGAVLPLSHQDIGDWPFVNHPWVFALPFNETGDDFTKDFLGAEALRQDAADAPHTLPFVGRDQRKVSTPARVVEPGGREIGAVLTCATDTAIGWTGGRLVSITSPGRPETFTPKGLSCGFVRVDRQLSPGSSLQLDDGRRQITVQVASDIRPDRTARRAPIDRLWSLSMR